MERTFRLMQTVRENRRLVSEVRVASDIGIKVPARRSL
jgi:hypothetical protein